MSSPNHDRETPEANRNFEHPDEHSNDSQSPTFSEGADDAHFRQAVQHSIRSQQVSFEEELRQALEESVEDNETRQRAHAEELRQAVEESTRDYETRQRAYAEELRQAVEESTRDHETRQRAHVEERQQSVQQLEASMRQKCPICTEPMKDPRTTRCRHTFCHECISIWLENSDSCPIDGMRCSMQDLE